jgi:hypothetical protein
MGDPRNVAHAKKVSQEKHHKGDGAHSHEPGKKARQQQEKHSAAEQSSAVKPAESAKPEQKPDAAKLEKSLAVLAKLKELEFHSRANIEKLAELSLTIEDELKQKAFVEPIGAVYSAQDAFQSRILALITDYEAECQRLKPAAG